jgi:hypothetical protein
MQVVDFYDSEIFAGLWLYPRKEKAGSLCYPTIVAAGRDQKNVDVK